MWRRNNFNLIFFFSCYALSLTILVYFLPFWKLALWPLETYQATRPNYAFFAALLIIFLGLLLAYILGYRQINNSKKEGSKQLKIMFWAFAILSLLSFFIFPIGASDIFCYIFQGRIFSLHNLSPYLTLYSELGHDAFFPFFEKSIWINHPAPYGPFFLSLSGLFALLGAKKLIGAFLIFKIFALGLNAINAWLIYRLGGIKAFYLYAFNPLIIFELAINAHNEALIVFLILAALYLFKKRPYFSWLSYFVSALSKFYTILLAPIFLIQQIKAVPNKKRWNLFLGISLLSLASTSLFYYPFLEKFNDLFIPIKAQGELYLSAFRSPLIILLDALKTLLKLKLSSASLLSLGRLIFLAFYTLLLCRAYKKWQAHDSQGQVLFYSFLIMTAFFLSSLTWLMPWYYVLSLALGSLYVGPREEKAEERKIFYALIILSFLGLSYYLILR